MAKEEQEQEEKEQSKIPVGKIRRAVSFAGAGGKVGRNYFRYFGDRMRGQKDAKDRLHERNASDLYKSLGNLKGSALKVAQILSMDNSVLPEAYTQQFAKAQYSAPPLSYPLVEKTFVEQLGKKPTEIFDEFSRKAVYAASIGQVHRAVKDGQAYAIKVQYPGVANSIDSDLRMVKPIAKAMFDINESEVDYYMEEVKEKLLEETNYELELQQAEEIGTAINKVFPDIKFPKYYKKWSSSRVLTMEWIEGQHIKDYIATEPSQEERNRIGQELWNFYDYQIHELRKVHADPHPGNFLITPQGNLAVVDFGCCKYIPKDFHDGYFRLLNKKHLDSDTEFRQDLLDMTFIYEDEPEDLIQEYIALYREVLSLLGRPFFNEEFDFGDQTYFQEISDMGQSMQHNPLVKKSKRSRGNRHALYLNRSFFGLYNLLFMLKARVRTYREFELMD